MNTQGTIFINFAHYFVVFVCNKTGTPNIDIWDWVIGKILSLVLGVAYF